MNEEEMFQVNEEIKFRVTSQDAQEFIDWVKDKSFCNSGQHICDRLATQFEYDLGRN